MLVVSIIAGFIPSWRVTHENVFHAPWRWRSGRRSRRGQEAAGAISAGAAAQTAGKKWAWDYNRKRSIGRVKAYYGNFGVLVRALAYILAHGGPGLRNATVDAVLNAVYIRKRLEAYYDLPYSQANMHEVVFSDNRQAKLGVHTGDIAKRLIDYGFHPYTVSFPMIVHGALMIEPTETEGKHELDQFIAAMISIAGEIETIRNWL